MHEIIYLLHVGLFTPSNIHSSNASRAEQMTEKKNYKRGRGFQFEKTRGNWTGGQCGLNSGTPECRRRALAAPSRCLAHACKSNPYCVLWICLCCNKSVVYTFEFVSFKMLVLMRTCNLHERNTNEETKYCYLNSRGCESGRQQTCRPFYRNAMRIVNMYSWGYWARPPVTFIRKNEKQNKITSRPGF